ncbi:MAG: HAMP domain-containing histidine kinase [Ruminococcus sp.]|nr:HAMP domain-containing histidine kinase [Ruminococcus sp.]
MKWVVIALFAALSAVIVLLMIRLVSIRRDIKNLAQELRRTHEPGYDRLVRVRLNDKAVEELAAEINRTIDGQKRLKLDAEEAERRMRRSMSDIAHDLRTPLAVIKGDLQLIADGELPDKSRGYLDICLQKTEQLKCMTDQFFELAVLESDSGRVPVVRTDLTAAVMNFLVENEGRISLAGIEPEVIFPPKTVFVRADAQLLGRMFGNLLGNVLKYSCGDLAVIVGAEDGGSVSFENSVGENISEPERIFERSYRGDSSRGGGVNGSQGGAGLGLYIVRLLAEKQGAAVSARLTDGRLRVTIAFENEQ